MNDWKRTEDTQERTFPRSLVICSFRYKHWTRSKTHYTEKNFYYLDEVDTLDDVDTDDDVDTELDVDKLKFNNTILFYFC